MKDNGDIPQSLSDILAALRYRELFAQGWLDAIISTMTHEDIGNDELGRPTKRINIRSKAELVSKLEEKQSALPSVTPIVNISVKQTEVYNIGYVAGLEFVIDLVVNTPSLHLPGSKTEYKRPEQFLFYQQYFSSGQATPLSFSIEHQASTIAIENEIEETKSMIATNEGGMGAGASPRIFNEGYLDGLNEALTIIARVTSGERLPFTEHEA